jgi:uracil phosphoribosyltransferase
VGLESRSDETTDRSPGGAARFAVRASWQATARMEALHVIDHPLLARALAALRAADTSRAVFRDAMAAATNILAYEALRDLPVHDIEVRTPLEVTTASVPARPVAVVAILRAGLGMVDGFLNLVPDAAVGHLGMRRNEETHKPEAYYESLPSVIAQDVTTFVVDPMLATGGSAIAALSRLRAAGAGDLRLVCLVAAPEGVEAVRAVEPDIPITVAALDRELDERAFIRPGLGDAGDRIFGTDE